VFLTNANGVHDWTGPPDSPLVNRGLLLAADGWKQMRKRARCEKESAVSVFNHCERTETVILHFKYPLWIVEGLSLTA
jgi:hypothetical protein